ncbi:MAG: hypothetical protein WKI04_09775 [Ferruginibacter sp.]
MKPAYIISLLGHSVNNPEIEKTLNFFEIKERPGERYEMMEGFLLQELTILNLEFTLTFQQKQDIHITMDK